MKKGVRARIAVLEEQLNEVVEGNYDGGSNMSELDVVVEIAQELLDILKGDK
jgi:hypothetical protein